MACRPGAGLEASSGPRRTCAKCQVPPQRGAVGTHNGRAGQRRRVDKDEPNLPASPRLASPTRPVEQSSVTDLSAELTAFSVVVVVVAAASMPLASSSSFFPKPLSDLPREKHRKIWRPTNVGQAVAPRGHNERTNANLAAKTGRFEGTSQQATIIVAVQAKIPWPVCG